MDYTCHYNSPLGSITLASDGKALTGLWFEGQKYFAQTLGKENIFGNLPVFSRAARWLDIYFSGEEPDFTPLLSISNMTNFRRRVCEIMLTIPYGQTMTYGEITRIIAAETGKEKMSAQAIGGAVGHNPISVIIPCHRVVGTNGSLTGYAGGIDLKIRLLELEKTDMTGLFFPKNKST